MDSKTDLRIKAKSIIKNLDIDTLSLSAVSKIRENYVYKQSQNVLLFYPLKYEINLLDLLNDDKNFYLPKVDGDKLVICPFKKGDKLEKSHFNIEEPCSNPCSPLILDLIILPALMADAAGYRLGYGGGFYDKFLAENSSVPAILPIAKELYVKELPHENFDIKADIVITC